jgi:hypothetical protein
MSTAQLELELPTLNSTELDALEAALRREKLRRSGRILSAEETRLFETINQPAPGAERFRQLETAWQAGALSEAERAELLEIVEAREELNARRVEAVMELAKLRGVPFTALWRQTMGEAPQPRLIES